MYAQADGLPEDGIAPGTPFAALPAAWTCPNCDAAKADEVKRLFEEQGRPLVAQGTEVLIPGGGIPMLLFSQFKDHRIDGAPVINGIHVAVKMAQMAVELKRLTGQGVSRVGDYTKAPDWVIEEFLTHPKGL